MSKSQPNIEEMALKYAEDSYAIIPSGSWTIRSIFLAGAAAQRKLEQERVKGLVEALEKITTISADYFNTIGLAKSIATGALKQYKEQANG